MEGIITNIEAHMTSFQFLIDGIDLLEHRLSALPNPFDFLTSLFKRKFMLNSLTLNPGLIQKTLISGKWLVSALWNLLHTKMKRIFLKLFSLNIVGYISSSNER